MTGCLMEQLQNDIVISEINGISDIVILWKIAAHVLCEFYDQQKSSHIEEEKQRIIVAAAELIKSEINEVRDHAKSGKFRKRNIEGRYNSVRHLQRRYLELPSLCVVSIVTSSVPISLDNTKTTRTRLRLYT